MFCLQMSSFLLVGDYRVKHIRSSSFKTRAFKGERLSFFIRYFKNNQHFISNFSFVVLAAGINDVSDKVGFNNHKENREIFLDIKNKVSDAVASCPTQLILATIVPRDLKKVAIAFPSKCTFHSSVITEE